jgi:hypothetical protein
LAPDAFENRALVKRDRRFTSLRQKYAAPGMDRWLHR